MNVQLLKDWSSTPQNFVSKVKDYLVDNVGWTLVTTISSTEFDKDYVVTSSGTNPTTSPFFIRIRGYDNYVYLRGYEDFQDINNHSGEIHDPTYSRVYTSTSGNEFQYWFFANSDHFKFVIRETATENNYHGYAGLIKTYYTSGVDSSPLLIHGTQGSTEHWGDSNSPWMMTSGGSGVAYKAYAYSPDYLGSARGDHYGGFKLLLYHDDPDSQEVRGEPYGVLGVPTSLGGRGIEYVLPSGIYYGFNKSGSQDYGYLYGPVQAIMRC